MTKFKAKFRLLISNQLLWLGDAIMFVCSSSPSKVLIPRANNYYRVYEYVNQAVTDAWSVPCGYQGQGKAARVNRPTSQRHRAITSNRNTGPN